MDLINNAAKYFGHVNVTADEDGIVRRLPLFIKNQGQEIPSLSLKIADFVAGRSSQETINRIGNWLRVNFIGPPGSFKTISFSDVYENNFLADDFKNKIVLVGVTSSDLHDQQMTPFSLGQEMPGVEIHANAIQTLLNQKFIKEVGTANVLGFIFLFSLINVLSFSFLRRIWAAALAGIFSIFVYLTVAVIFFEQGLVLNLVYPCLSFVFSLVVILLYRYFSENREKDYLRQSFQYYLSPEVVEEVIANPEKLKLGGAKKEMTVLFSDIRGFTTLSEKVEPEKLVSLLNEYFTAMTEVILQSGGVLDKFIGDAIMAFWGAPQEEPEHSRRACEAALAMMERLEILKKNWVRRGLPEINIGVGVNSGLMIVGNMGSEKRFDYTVIGDNVNLASRLEGLNKQYNTNIIISQFTYEKVKDSFEAEFLDEVKVKGKDIAVKIYKLIGRK
jgi:adenylate cyclase